MKTAPAEPGRAAARARRSPRRDWHSAACIAEVVSRFDVVGLQVEKAVHEGLRALCESIIQAPSAEIEQMQTWLRDWYGISYEPQLSTGQMQPMQRLEKFTGAKFEIEFMRSMIHHHWKALREAETAWTVPNTTNF
ncbi:DUF305 domain-containing protein [Arthrobacter sp. CC3]|uniref:DUF305 domain-containing protein n=1 Tax=Arthrobacter sp. CC3 TaxID=3029185 RepID=UPI00326590E1